MGSYKKLGIATLIILIFLALAIYKVNTLVLSQIDQAGDLQKPSVETPKQVKEAITLESKVIEGVVIEGQPSSAVGTQNPPSTSTKGRENKEAVYELPPDDIILIQ